MRAALGALLLAFGAGAGAEMPVAFVADIHGSATIEGNGKLAFLAELSEGTRLLLGSGAHASIAYAATGAEFALVGPGEFRVSEREVTAERGAQPRKRTVAALGTSAVVGKAAQSASASTRMRSIPSAGPQSMLEYPVATRIATLKPTLRWRPETAHGEYTVLLMDGDGKEIWRGKDTLGSARPGVTLQSGARYAWSIAGAKGGVGNSEFETLPAEALKRVAASTQGKSFSDRVVRALLLQDVGAHQEAQQAWAQLARERPDLPELAALAR
jgi:hypothetical protein